MAQDSNDNITKQTKSESANAPWLQNALKSIGVATKMTFEEYMPNTTSLVSSMVDTTKTMGSAMTSIKRSKGNVNNLTKQLSNNPYVKVLTDAYKNALKDLKSGDITGESRGKSDSNGSDSGESSYSFGDEDTGGVIEVQEDSSGNTELVNSIRQQTEAQLKTGKAKMQADIAMASTFMSQSQANHDAMMKTLNDVSSNIATLVEFQNKTMMDYIKASTAYMEAGGRRKEEKDEGSKRIGSDDVINLSSGKGGSGLNVSNYGRYVKQNAKEYLENTPLGPAIAALSSPENLAMVLQAPLQLGFSLAVDHIMPQVISEGLQRVEERISSEIPALLTRVGALVNPTDKSALGYLKNFIGKTFGLRMDDRTERFDVKGSIVKGPVDFDGSTRHAITEIIPKELREQTAYLKAIADKQGIDTHKTRQSSEVFDYNTATYKTLEQVQTEFVENLKANVLGSFDGKGGEFLNDLIDKVSLGNEELKQEVSSAIQQMSIIMSTTQDSVARLGDSTDQAYKNVLDIMKSAGINENTVGAIDSYLVNARYDKNSRPALNDIARNALQAKNRITATNEDMKKHPERYNIYAQNAGDRDIAEILLNSYDNKGQGLDASKTQELIREAIRNGTYSTDEDDEESGGLFGGLFKRDKSAEKEKQGIIKTIAMVIAGTAGGIVTKVAEMIKGDDQKNGVFADLKEKFKTNFVNPAKELLFGSKDKPDSGLFSGIKNSVNDTVNSIRFKINGLGYQKSDGTKIDEDKENSLFGKLGKVAGDIKDSIAEKLFGKKDDTGQREGGAIKFITDTLQEGVKGWSDAIFGDDGEREGIKEDLLQKAKDALPNVGKGALAGGAIGLIGGGSLLGSIFGGPIGGALIGAVGGLLSKSDSFKNWLFGEEVDGERQGGVISKNVQEYFKNNKGSLGAGAVGGVLFGGMIPGVGLLGSIVGGPVAGALAGMGVSIALKSETFQSLIFGEMDEKTGKRSGGLKGFLADQLTSITGKASEVNKKSVGMGVLGAGAGFIGGKAIAAAIGSHGLLGAAFSAAGPIGLGITGLALSFSAAQGKLKSFLFGDKNEKDQYGTENSGVFGRLGNMLKANLITPLKNTAKSIVEDMAITFKYDIVENVKTVVNGIAEPFRALGKYLKDEAIGIGKKIMEAFQPSVEALGKAVEPLVNVARVALRGVYEYSKAIITAPFRAAAAITKVLTSKALKAVGAVVTGAAGIINKLVVGPAVNYVITPLANAAKWAVESIEKYLVYPLRVFGAGMVRLGQYVGKGILNKVKGFATTVGTIAGNIVGGVVGKAKDSWLGRLFREHLIDPIRDTVVGGFKNILGGIKDFVGKPFKWIRDKAEKADKKWGLTSGGLIKDGKANIREVTDDMSPEEKKKIEKDNAKARDKERRQREKNEKILGQAFGWNGDFSDTEENRKKLRLMAQTDPKAKKLLSKFNTLGLDAIGVAGEAEKSAVDGAGIKDTELLSSDPAKLSATGRMNQTLLSIKELIRKFFGRSDNVGDAAKVLDESQEATIDNPQGSGKSGTSNGPTNTTGNDGGDVTTIGGKQYHIIKNADGSESYHPVGGSVLVDTSTHDSAGSDKDVNTSGDVKDAAGNIIADDSDNTVMDRDAAHQKTIRDQDTKEKDERSFREKILGMFGTYNKEDESKSSGVLGFLGSLAGGFTSIFSKKGLLTVALLAFLPTILKNLPSIISAIGSIGSFLLENLPSILETVGNIASTVISNLPTILETIGTIAGTVLDILTPLGKIAKSLGEVMDAGFTSIINGLKTWLEHGNGEGNSTEDIVNEELEDLGEIVDGALSLNPAKLGYGIHDWVFDEDGTSDANSYAKLHGGYAALKTKTRIGRFLTKQSEKAATSKAQNEAIKKAYDEAYEKGQKDVAQRVLDINAAKEAAKETSSNIPDDLYGAAAKSMQSAGDGAQELAGEYSFSFSDDFANDVAKSTAKTIQSTPGAAQESTSAVLNIADDVAGQTVDTTGKNIAFTFSDDGVSSVLNSYTDDALDTFTNTIVSNIESGTGSLYLINGTNIGINSEMEYTASKFITSLDDFTKLTASEGEQVFYTYCNNGAVAVVDDAASKGLIKFIQATFQAMVTGLSTKLNQSVAGKALLGFMGFVIGALKKGFKIIGNAALKLMSKVLGEDLTAMSTGQAAAVIIKKIAWPVLGGLNLSMKAGVCRLFELNQSDYENLDDDHQSPLARIAFLIGAIRNTLAGGVLDLIFTYIQLFFQTNIWRALAMILYKACMIKYDSDHGTNSADELESLTNLFKEKFDEYANETISEDYTKLQSAGLLDSNLTLEDYNAGVNAGEYGSTVSSYSDYNNDVNHTYGAYLMDAIGVGTGFALDTVIGDNVVDIYDRSNNVIYKRNGSVFDAYDAATGELIEEGFSDKAVQQAAQTGLIRYSEMDRTKGFGLTRRIFGNYAGDVVTDAFLNDNSKNEKSNYQEHVKRDATSLDNYNIKLDMSDGKVEITDIAGYVNLEGQYFVRMKDGTYTMYSVTGVRMKEGIPEEHIQEKINDGTLSSLNIVPDEVECDDLIADVTTSYIDEISEKFNQYKSVYEDMSSKRVEFNENFSATLYEDESLILSDDVEAYYDAQGNSYIKGIKGSNIYSKYSITGAHQGDLSEKEMEYLILGGTVWEGSNPPLVIDESDLYRDIQKEYGSQVKANLYEMKDAMRGSATLTSVLDYTANTTNVHSGDSTITGEGSSEQANEEDERLASVEAELDANRVTYDDDTYMYYKNPAKNAKGMYGYVIKDGSIDMDESFYMYQNAEKGSDGKLRYSVYNIATGELIDNNVSSDQFVKSGNYTIYNGTKIIETKYLPDNYKDLPETSRIGMNQEKALSQLQEKVAEAHQSELKYSDITEILSSLPTVYTYDRSVNTTYIVKDGQTIAIDGDKSHTVTHYSDEDTGDGMSTGQNLGGGEGAPGRKKLPNPLGMGDDALSKPASTVNGFKYYSQNDPSWSNMSYDYNNDGGTVGNSGCVPTAMAMITSQIKHDDVTPAELSAFSSGAGYRVDGGTDERFVDNISSTFGINERKIDNPNTNSITGSLLQGDPMLLFGYSDSSGPYTGAGHSIVASGLDGNGNVKILDPRGKSYNRTMTPKELARYTQKAVSFTSGNTSEKGLGALDNATNTGSWTADGSDNKINIIAYNGSHRFDGNRQGVKYIVLHYTAGPTSAAGSALSCAQYTFDKAGEGSADYIVDDAQIVQYNGDIANQTCQAVGGSWYTNKTTSEFQTLRGICTNFNSISIEICSTRDGGAVNDPMDPGWYFTDAVLDNALALTNYLMSEYNVDVDHVCMHHNVTGKICPAPWVRHEEELAGYREFKSKLTGKSPGANFIDRSNSGVGSNASSSNWDGSATLSHDFDVPSMEDLVSGNTIFGGVYYSQSDEPWGQTYLPNTGTTVQAAGCKVAATASLISSLTGQKFTPTDVIDQYRDCFDASGGLTSVVINPKLKEDFNIDVESTDDEETVRAALQVGKPVLMHGGGTPYGGTASTSGHFIVGTVTDSTGNNAYILDPGWRANMVSEKFYKRSLDDLWNPSYYHSPAQIFSINGQGISGLSQASASSGSSDGTTTTTTTTGLLDSDGTVIDKIGTFMSEAISRYVNGMITGNFDSDYHDFLYGTTTTTSTGSSSSSSSVGINGLYGSTRPEQIWNYLRMNGFTEEGTAGALGGLWGESTTHNPNTQEGVYDDEKNEAYAAQVDSGEVSKDEFVNVGGGNNHGYGIAQWTSLGRKQGLYEATVEKGLSIADMKGQLDYLMSELNTSYKECLNTVKPATDIGTALHSWVYDFERPGDKAGAYNTRLPQAQKYYDQYQGMEIPSGSSGTYEITPSSGAGGSIADVTSIPASDSINNKVYGNSRAEKVWNFMRGGNLNFNKLGTAGAMAAAWGENMFETTQCEGHYNSQPAGRTYNQAFLDKVDGGQYSKEQFMNENPSGRDHGYGMFSWTDPAQKGLLWDWTVGKGYSLGDMGQQLDLMSYQVNSDSAPAGTSYRSKLRDMCRNASSTFDGASGWINYFEYVNGFGASDSSRLQGAVAQRDAAYSKLFYDKFASNEHPYGSTSSLGSGTGITLGYGSGPSRGSKVRSSVLGKSGAAKGGGSILGYGSSSKYKRRKKYYDDDDDNYYYYFRRRYKKDDDSDEANIWRHRTGSGSSYYVNSTTDDDTSTTSSTTSSTDTSDYYTSNLESDTSSTSSVYGDSSTAFAYLEPSEENGTGVIWDSSADNVTSSRYRRGNNQTASQVELFIPPVKQTEEEEGGSELLDLATFIDLFKTSARGATTGFDHFESELASNPDLANDEDFMNKYNTYQAYDEAVNKITGLTGYTDSYDLVNGSALDSLLDESTAEVQNNYNNYEIINSDDTSEKTLDLLQQMIFVLTCIQDNTGITSDKLEMLKEYNGGNTTIYTNSAGTANNYSSKSSGSSSTAYTSSSTGSNASSSYVVSTNQKYAHEIAAG